MTRRDNCEWMKLRESSEWLLVGKWVSLGNRISSGPSFLTRYKLHFCDTRECVSGNTNKETKYAAQATITPYHQGKMPWR